MTTIDHRPLADLPAIVTGGANGLGAATACLFAALGAKVIVADIDDARGEALAAQIGGHYRRCDVTSEADFEALVGTCVDRHGWLGCMINNAGQLGALGGIADITLDAWNRTVTVLLTSVFLGTKHAARVMGRNGERGGSILNTASVGGIAALAPHAYTAAKHGVVGLTRSAASELAADGIRVNAVAPGSVPSRLTELAYGGMEAMEAAQRARNPLGTIVSADEIAGCFAWLAGPDGRNVTGQVIAVDSGLTELRLNADYYRKDATFFGRDGIE
ncbi:SDR family oxidoreductase [Croceicoccus sp. BE223]|uniref:SDR family oxidoreductase n=1 Tax=Croceicoccus sp. BE223 TaxID=2817716 RepID=UPI0028559430|nr:SDR family oxidoreductase [Croceicoccus sp. BE223]MDR7101372.1 NAD(P)-dependent dehydrogenase (short-subunit alcohol dehydrogenase family) [Croceicoccus sp. BE223]